jgi:hypothetical protein
MDYFEINDPKDKRMCLLVHANSPETDNKDADEYTDLIEKIGKIYIYIYLKNRDFMLAFDSTKQEKKRVRRQHNMKSNYDAWLRIVHSTAMMTK